MMNTRIIITIVLASLYSMQSTFANMQCSIDSLRQCNGTDNSTCCQHLNDPYLKMETGFYTGNLLVVRICY